MGINEKGKTGGYKKGGIPEAVINQLAPGDYVKKQVYMKGSIK